MHAPGSEETSLELLGRVTKWEDQPAWETFSHLYRPLLHAYALRSGLTDEEAQEVAQDTLLEVAVRLRNGEYQRAQSSFRGWLYRLARWRIINQFHKRRPGHVSLDQPGITATAGAAGEDETWNEEWRRALLATAFERLRGRMNPKHFQVLHALVWHGWPPERVAHTFGLSRAAVHLIKFRGLSRLKRQVARLEKSPPPERPNDISHRTPAKTARRKK